MLMSLESTTNRMLRIAQSVIYFNKIKSVEETVKHIQSVTAKDIQEMSNELFYSSNKFENGGLTRVILSSKNLLPKKVV
jgi:predicted Zn-dependent peptidase